MDHLKPKSDLYGVPWTTDAFNGMPYRLLGRSGLRVSSMGLGTYKIGYPDTGDGSRIDEKNAFKILDRAVAPDKKSSPKRSLIVILTTLVAFFLAVFLAFFFEYVDRIKTEDQERYRLLVDNIRFRKTKISHAEYAKHTEEKKC